MSLLFQNTNTTLIVDAISVSDEFMISQNGPVISKCDKIVERSLTKYFGGKNKWHFVKGDRALFKGSKVLNKIKNEKSHLAFIEL